MTDRIDPLALTIPDACRRLGVSRTTIYELLKQGEIRSFKVASRTMIPDSDLRDFVAKRLESALAPFNREGAK